MVMRIRDVGAMGAMAHSDEFMIVDVVTHVGL